MKRREWLKEQRMSKGYTQNEVANLLHVTPRYYQYIEWGQRSPHVEVGKELGKLLGFDWTKLYEGEEDEG